MKFRAHKAALSLGWAAVLVACSLEDSGSSSLRPGAGDEAGSSSGPDDGGGNQSSDTSTGNLTDAGGDASSEACRPEICNGADDDCNGTIDEGCPASVTLSDAFTGSSDAFGDPDDGYPFVEGCGSNAAIVSLRGRVGKYIDVVQVGCAPVLLIEDKSQPLYTYRIAHGSPIDYQPAHGTVYDGTTSFSLTCPDNAVGIGIAGQGKDLSGSSGDRGVFTLSLVCAEVQILGTRDAYSLGFGTPVTFTATGTVTGDAFSFAGTAPKVLVASFGQASAHVYTFGVAQRTVQLSVR